MMMLTDKKLTRQTNAQIIELGLIALVLETGQISGIRYLNVIVVKRHLPNDKLPNHRNDGEMIMGLQIFCLNDRL